MAAIYEIFGTDAHKMTLALMEAARVAERIPAGAPVALKPNLVLAGSPEDGATTHPGVISGCVEYLRANGVEDISVIESAWVGAKTEEAAAKSGCAQVCRRYGVPFFDLKRDKTRTVETPLRPMEICCRALDAGFLIDLPVLKGHCQTAMTCALKNCKGCIPDREKRRFHTEGLMEPIAALAAVLIFHRINFPFQLQFPAFQAQPLDVQSRTPHQQQSKRGFHADQGFVEALYIHHAGNAQLPAPFQNQGMLPLPLHLAVHRHLHVLLCS